MTKFLHVLARLFRRPLARGKPRATHRIIVNDERDYLVWPADSSLPPQWRYVGKSGSEAELREFVATQLNDTAPAPLRRDG